MMLALLCACSFSIVAGPLKFTCQLLIVFLIGLMLPLRDGLLILICYMIMGLSGLPVFAGFTGGFGYIYNPTFGFVYGFLPGLIAMRAVMKYAPDRGKKRIVLSVGACLVCQLICYIFGFIHGYLILNVRNEAGYTFFKLMSTFILPYIPIDFIKIALSVSVSTVLYPLYDRLSKR